MFQHILRRVLPAAAVGLSSMIASAADPSCGRPSSGPSCGTDGDCGASTPRRVLVPVPVPVPMPLCHCLRGYRPWFMPVEPPRGEVLESVTVLRQAAPLQSEFAFEVVQDKNASQAMKNAIRNAGEATEPGCAGESRARNGAPPKPSTGENASADRRVLDEKDAEIATLRAEIRTVNDSLTAVRERLEIIGIDYVQFKRTTAAGLAGAAGAPATVEQSPTEGSQAIPRRVLKVPVEGPAPK